MSTQVTMVTTQTLLTVLLASLQAATAFASLPRPQLHVDYDVVVLHLQCSPPAIAVSTWSKILSVAISRRDTPDRSANVTSFAYGQAVPVSGEFLRGRSSAVQALGAFDDKTIKLSVLFPMTTSDKSFACDIAYLQNDHANALRFSQTLDVTQFRGGGFRNHDFEYRTIHAHNVSIEWSSSNVPQHGQLTVSRFSLGRDGQQAEARQILLALDPRRGDLAAEDVLIVEFKPTIPVGKASLTVFVTSSTCGYDCYIPHQHCYDQDEKLCHCRWETDRRACGVVEAYPILLWVFLALWISSLVPTITFCCCLRCRRGKLFREMVQFVKCNERPKGTSSEEEPALGPEGAEEDPGSAEKKSDQERRDGNAIKATDDVPISMVEIPTLKGNETPDSRRGQLDSRRGRAPERQPRGLPSGSRGSRRIDDGGLVDADRNSGARPKTRTNQTIIPSPRDVPLETKSVLESTIDPNHSRDHQGSRPASVHGFNERRTLTPCAGSMRSSEGSTESALNPECLQQSLNTHLRDNQHAYSTTSSTPILSGETDSDHALRDKP